MSFSRRDMLKFSAATGALALAGCQSSGGGPPVDFFDKVASPDADFTSDLSSSNGVVSKNMIGSNVLFDREDIEGTYGTRADLLGVELLRWPGGTMSERDFGYQHYSMTDLDQPGAPTTLTKLMRNSNQTGRTVSIVAPTWRYQDDFAKGVSEVSNLVRRVTSGEFGNGHATIWEIGNEFYGDGGLSASAYGALASQLSNAIRDAAQYPVQIAVQAGRETDEMRAIHSKMEAGQYDLLINHMYAHTSGEARHSERLHHIRSIWGNAPIFGSEWNISSKDSSKFDHDWGLRQATGMLWEFDLMVRMNSAAAALWPIQNVLRTASFDLEGSKQTVPYVAGFMLQWLGKTKQMVRRKTGQKSAIGVDVSVYADSSKAVVFVGGKNHAAGQVSVKLDGFSPASVTSKRMTAPPSTSKTIPDIRDGGVTVDGDILTVPINQENPYEMTMIELS